VVTEDGANAYEQRGVLFVTNFRSKTGPEPEVQIIAKIAFGCFAIIEHCGLVLENSLVVGLHERAIYEFTNCSASLLHPMRFKWVHLDTVLTIMGKMVPHRQKVMKRSCHEKRSEAVGQLGRRGTGSGG
jgi:hypothetical protein